MIFHILFLYAAYVVVSFAVPFAYRRRKKGYAMKIKDRFEKQNNSIRQLLKKLRRHDTVVVAIAVMIALVLCGGLIYLSTPAMAEAATLELEQSEKEN